MVGSLARTLSMVLTSSFVLLNLPHTRADSVSLQPAADTSLIEFAPNNNLGGAVFFNAGTAGNGNRNRALMLFDLSGVIPPGSVITSAELTMDIVRQPSSGQENSIFSLRPILQPWGEGVQVPADSNSPGVGAPAAPGEATWTARFAPGSGWSQPGGQPGVDFSTEISSTAFVGSLGEQVMFESTPSLVANLQMWLDQPTSNFGWMLATESEDLGKTARGFASRESGFGPTLTVQFTAVPEPGTISLLCLFLLGLAAASRLRR